MTAPGRFIVKHRRGELTDDDIAEIRAIVKVRPIPPLVRILADIDGKKNG